LKALKKLFSNIETFEAILTLCEFQRMSQNLLPITSMGVPSTAVSYHVKNLTDYQKKGTVGKLLL